MRALKAIVIGMGALIVLAVALIGFGLYKKSVDPGWKLFGTTPEAAPAVTTPAPSSFDPIKLGFPDGCMITDMRPDGRRLFLMVGPEPGCEGVVVIDISDGRVLGMISAR